MKQNVRITKYAVRSFIISIWFQLISISTYCKQSRMHFGKPSRESADFDIGDPHFEMMKQKKLLSKRRPYSYFAIGTFFKAARWRWLMFDPCRSNLSI